MTNTYSYNDGQFSVMGHFLKCSKCGKKIIVNITLCGVNHNIAVHATCASCIKINTEFKEKHPDIVKQIEEFCGDGI